MFLDERLEKILEILKNELNSGKSLDEIKNLVPESYLTNIVWTINFRSLINFLRLRTSKGAHYKIQELSFLILNEIPDSHKFLFQYS